MRTRSRKPPREPGSLSLDQRLEQMNERIEEAHKKLDRVLLLVLLGTLGIGGGAALDITSAVASALTP